MKVDEHILDRSYNLDTYIYLKTKCIELIYFIQVYINKICILNIYIKVKKINFNTQQKKRAHAKIILKNKVK